jgi:hypothetical protein
MPFRYLEGVKSCIVEFLKTFSVNIFINMNSCVHGNFIFLRYSSSECILCTAFVVLKLLRPI